MTGLPRRLALAHLATGVVAAALRPVASAAAIPQSISHTESVPPPETGRVPVEASPDAALLAACAAFDALSVAHDALDGDDDAQFAEQRRLSGLQGVLAERITAHRATSLAAHVARARSLVAWAPEIIGPNDGRQKDEVLLQGLLRDLVATAPVPAP